MALQNRLDHRDLGVGGGAQLVAFVGLGGRVEHPLVVGHRDPDLDALGRCDPALRLDVLPRRVIPLRADQREHITFAAVLADQRRGQAQAPAGLQIGGHPEHRRRQQMHLVVDDEAPVPAVEQLEVFVLTLGPPGDHLIGRDGHRPDLFALPGVLADLLFGQRRACDQLALPLPAGHGVGHQDQRRRAGFRHGCRADQGLAGAAGQHDDTGAAVPERVGCHLLVVAQRPAVLFEGDRVLFAIDITGQVLGRPPDLEQHLLDPAPLTVVHHDGVVVEARTQHRCDLLVAQHFLEYRAVEADQRQAVGRVLDELEAAVSRHRVDDVDEQRLRNRVSRVGHQGVDDLLGVVAGGAGVPQSQRCDAVGVDVFGSALQLGERCDRRAGGSGQLMIDLEQHRLVGLHDQRAVGHGRSR